MKTLKDDGNPLKVVQKLMISSVGERDYSAQETCHLLLQLPMFMASRDFVILSLDSSRQLEDQLEQGERVTVDSQLDHYRAHPSTPHFEDMTLLQFVQSCRTPKRAGEAPVFRIKQVVVIVRPCCSPDPMGPKYDQYYAAPTISATGRASQNVLMHTPTSSILAQFLPLLLMTSCVLKLQREQL